MKIVDYIANRLGAKPAEEPVIVIPQKPKQIQGPTGTPNMPNGWEAVFDENYACVRIYGRNLAGPRDNPVVHEVHDAITLAELVNGTGFDDQDHPLSMIRIEVDGSKGTVYIMNGDPNLMLVRDINLRTRQIAPYSPER